MALIHIISDPEQVLAMTVESLSQVLLPMLARRNMEIDLSLFFRDGSLGDYPETHRYRIKRACMEAFQWLLSEGLLAPNCESGNGTVFVTRVGKACAADAARFADFQVSRMLPVQLLHPAIAAKAHHLRAGDYSTATFEVFKELEVAIREASGLPASEIGVSLARKAFDPKDGPLIDRSSLPAERQALSDLMAGAIGSYKNPSSHRHVPLGATDTVELFFLASHLLRIVDIRREARGEATPAREGS